MLKDLRVIVLDELHSLVTSKRGVLLSLALSRLLSTVLVGVSAFSIAPFVGVPILLTVVAFIACYIPARRATKVDPLVALRYE